MESSNLLKLKIITPERAVYQDEVSGIVIPTESGQVTILPNHQPLVTIAKTGEIKVTRKDKSILPMAISSGILEVRESFNKKDIPTEVIILAYRAEFAYEIDVKRAKESLERVQKILEAKEFESDVDFAKFQSMMEKEMNRIEIWKKWRN
ncbi:MAG: ATP synthase F1 subunit epsilon [Minisyncoccia bacterium]